MATTKLKGFINNDLVTVEPRQEVDLLVASESPIGYRVIVNNRHGACYTATSCSAP